MSTLALDHVVIYVPSLEQAVEQFTALGFTVHLGGEHKHTQNALIIFSDQFYIELLSLRTNWRRPLLLLAARCGLIDLIANTKSDISWRLLRWINLPYGAIDWCLRTDDIDKLLNDFLPVDIPILKSLRYQRRRKDGKIAAWALGGVKNVDLPYFIEDKTPIACRMPLGNHTNHVNGASGLRSLNLAAKDSLQSACYFSALSSSSIKEYKKDCLQITVGDATIDFSERTKAVGAFSLDIYYNGHDPVMLDARKTYGVRIRLVPINNG